MRDRLAPFAVAALLLSGCEHPLPRARLGAAEPPSTRELASARRIAEKRCPAGLGWLYPGLGHVCLRETEEGAALAAVATGDAAALIAGAATDQESLTFVAGTALQNAYLTGVVDVGLEQQRARRARFVPQDRLGELALAPFHPGVLARPEVLGGIIGTAALGITVFALVPPTGPRPVETDFGAPPRVFGREVSQGAGFAIAGATYTGLFTQVAVGEELVFRGFAQSAIARACGERCGWALGSLLFAAAHAPNALTYETDEARARYLAIGLPTLMLVSQYLGLVYWKDGYSLQPPVAIHFWYDLILSMAGFAADPTDTPISARVTLPL